MTPAPLLPAVMGHATTPLRGLRPGDMRPIKLGTPIGDLAPATQSPLVCRLNGDWLLRESWGRPVMVGDVIEWYELPQDRGTLQGVLFVAVMVLSIFYPPFAAYAPYVLAAGNLLINAYLPVLPPQQYDPGSQSPTYNTGLNGNQARLYQPIPKICGRHQIFPPLAAQPYTEYAENGDQYYYALFAVTVGRIEVERTLIDDTDIKHFSDVLTCEYLEPGVAPTAVLASVINAPEVTGANLDMLPGQYIGGYVACGPRELATHIGIDMVAPKGLGLSGDDGSIGSLTMTWRIEVRSINEFGTPISPWVALAGETRSASTNQVQRWSSKYELDTPIRPEIRVVRTGTRNDSLFALNDLNWTGLRAYLQITSPLNQNVTHLQLVMRSSKQLSSFSQSRISVIGTALARTWNPVGGWGDEVPTRNAAWSLGDLWTSTTWGEGLPDERCDLQSLYELSLIWEQRQDRFDFVFDTAMNAWDAGQLIARSGRARMFRRGGVRSLARDQSDTSAVTAFTRRNCDPDSMHISEALPQRDTPDGVIVEYFDNRQWDWIPIDCPAPGITTMEKPARLRLVGVTGRIHAEREGLYEAASAYFRTRKVECVTEMQGMLPAFMSSVRWQGDVSGYGQTGDVAFWDEEILVMGLTEPPLWGEEPLYLTLIRDDGSLTDPVQVTPGGGPNDVLLPEPPDFELVLDDGTRERPKFLLGTLLGSDLLVKINEISDGGLTEDGAQKYKIVGGVDDERVHHVDDHLLPGPDEVQDPIDTTEGEPGGGTFPVANLDTSVVLGINRASGGGEPPAVEAKYTLKNNGQAIGSDVSDGSTSVFSFAPNWLLVQPTETSDAALFQVRATYIGGFGPVADGTFGTWLSLDTDRFWRVEAHDTVTPDVELNMRVDIRDVATEIIQATASVRLQVNYIPPDSGGD